MPKYLICLLSAIVIIGLTGCSPDNVQTNGIVSKGETFDKNGLRFDCPAQWRLGDFKQILENEQMVSCEEDNAVASGIAIIKWIKAPFTAEDLLQKSRDAFTSHYRDEYGVEVKITDYDKKKNRLEFSLPLPALKHKGIMLAKNCGPFVVNIIFQSASVDFKKNLIAFEQIENSIACE